MSSQSIRIDSISVKPVAGFSKGINVYLSVGLETFMMRALQ